MARAVHVIKRSLTLRATALLLGALTVGQGCDHTRGRAPAEQPATPSPLALAPEDVPASREAALAAPAPPRRSEVGRGPRAALSPALPSATTDVPSLSAGAGAGAGRMGGQLPAASAAKGRPLQVASSPRPALSDLEMNTEAYRHITDNAFQAVRNQPLSTFSADVDTASYSNARRFLASGSLPPRDAIRVEEWINYFGYDYPEPTDRAPFRVTTEVTPCPWNAAHRLARIGIRGRSIEHDKVPPRNLVFLIDVSGSMMSEDKLPLVKRGLAMLADDLRPQDSLAIAVYAGHSGLVLPPTSGQERGTILSALQGLEAGGSTNGGQGIQLAYAVAQQQFKTGGVNRVILATDGDFNVGTTSEGELQRLIEEKRKSGVFLSVLGFGAGNVKDATMEMLADKGNGNYAYIDSLAEARKVLVREAGATLVTIAKDVKLQVEWNPARVGSYRLIGYENRLLANEDFNDDKKDAGDLGAGHTVTALYEVVPAGVAAASTPTVDPLKYQHPAAFAASAASSELLTVSIRYKEPSSDASTKLSVVVSDEVTPLARASDDARFAMAVANVALLLRGSPDVASSSLDSARALAASGVGADPHGDRRQFLALVDRAKRLQ